jgi:hypothetical protein
MEYYVVMVGKRDIAKYGEEFFNLFGILIEVDEVNFRQLDSKIGKREKDKGNKINQLMNR